MNREHATPPEDPKVCAMLVCDHAHRDSATGKFSLLGIFERIHVRQFPSTHGPLSVYLNLTNLNGSYALTLLVMKGEDESPIAKIETGQPLVVRDPLAHVEFAFGIPSLPVEKKGTIVFRLLANGRLVQDAVLWVVEAKGPPGVPPPPVPPPPPPPHAPPTPPNPTA